MKKIKHIEMSSHGVIVTYEDFKNFKEYNKEFLTDDFAVCVSPLLNSGEIIITCEDGKKNKIKINELCEFLLRGE